MCVGVLSQFRLMLYVIMFDCTYNLRKQLIVVTRDRYRIYKLFCDQNNRIIKLI